MKTFLHVGCGQKRKEHTTRAFNTPAWHEVRYDIDENASPDIVGTMLKMTDVADASVDAVFSSHNIEHIYPHEVPVALAEFLRVLKPDGFLLVACPDLQSICALVAEDKLIEAAYESPAGPIAPIDVIYGHRQSMAEGNLFMAHRCGFTQRTLAGTIKAAGFPGIVTIRRGYPAYDLLCLATKADLPDDRLRALAIEHFPS